MTENFERIWWNVMVGLATAFVVVGLAGCSAAGEGPAPRAVASTAPCDDAFWPESGHEKELQAAVDSWSAALGRDVCIHESGIPVFWQDKVYIESKAYTGYGCGDTHTNYNRGRDHTFAWVDYIAIADAQEGCHEKHTLLHEMGHALARRSFDDPPHVTAIGSMMYFRSSPSTEIDQLSIDFVCERSGC